MSQARRRLGSHQLEAAKLNKSRLRDVVLLPEGDGQRPVIVKRYPVADDALREYEVLARAKKNPRIPEVYAFFEDEGHWHIVMEYVQGKSLAQVIEEKGPLEAVTIIDLAIEILQAIGDLHKSGFVHGDLHGNNVIVTDLEQPRVKIIDFQHSVKMRKGRKVPARRKIRNPHLMLAPESKKGLIDERYDIYGVGYMCACMAAGVKLDKRPPKDPIEWEAHPFLKIVHKAMHPNPSKRYASTDKMIEALERHREEVKRRTVGAIHLSLRQPLYSISPR